MRSLRNNIQFFPEYIEGSSLEDRHMFARKYIYEPFLENSIKWEISTGAFSTMFFQLYRKSVIDFVNYSEKNKIYLIADNSFEQKDYDAIKNAVELKENFDKKNQTEYEIAIEESKTFDKGTSPAEFIADLLLRGQLEIKVGCAKEFRSIHHIKEKIWTDEEENYVVLSGSGNATYKGETQNNERGYVFYNWKDKRSELARMSFSKWWNDADQDFNFIPIPEAIKKSLIKIAPNNENEYWKEIIEKYESDNNPIIEKKLDLYEYQKNAIKKWEEEDCNGILSLATGTGKTIIAIEIIKKFIQKKQSCLIAVPWVDLQTQWLAEIEKWIPIKKYNYKIIKISSASRQKELAVFQSISKRAIEKNGPYIFVILYRSLNSEINHNILSKISENLLFVADEVHRLSSPGSEKIIEGDTKLQFPYTLGLSATPERHYDPGEVATNRLKNFFVNGIIYEYSINDAIYKDPRALIPYEYIPQTIYLTHQEMKKYSQLSAEWAQKKRKFDEEEDPLKKSEIHKQLEAITYKRAAIPKLAENKDEALVTLLIKNKNLNNEHTIIFAEQESQLKKLSKIISERTSIIPYEYYSGLNHEERKSTLENFLYTGGILINLEMFNEGIDIPQLKNLILISSDQSKLVSVQRRGRVLRIDRNDKNKTKAFVYDFISIPDTEMLQEFNSDSFDNLYDIEKTRMEMFDEDSLNSIVTEKYLKRGKLL